MEIKNDIEGINELDLFHGTSNTEPALIYEGEEGFDMRHSRKGLWGRGIYFAKDAAYSARSYAYGDGNTKQIFLARVITGFSKEMDADRSLRMPPVMDEEDCASYNVKFKGQRYDSVNGVTGDTPVYIIYNNNRAYPFYLITFTWSH